MPLKVLQRMPISLALVQYIPYKRAGESFILDQVWTVFEGLGVVIQTFNLPEIHRKCSQEVIERVGYPIFCS